MLISSLLRWVSISISEASYTHFRDAWSTPMDCFLSSRILVLLSQIATSSRCCCGCCCCCCCVCHLLFQRHLGCWPWCFEPFEMYSFSTIFSRNHDQFILLVLLCMPWLQMIFFAKILFLDPELFAIVPNFQHLGCVSNESRKVLSVGLYDRHEASLLPGHFQMDSLVFRKTAWRASIFLCASWN